MTDPIDGLDELLTEGAQPGWLLADRIADRLSQEIDARQVDAAFERIRAAGIDILEWDPGFELDLDEIAVRHPGGEVASYLKRVSRIRSLPPNHETLLLRLVRIGVKAERLLTEGSTDSPVLRQLARFLVSGAPGDHADPVQLAHRITRQGILARLLIIESHQQTVIRVAARYEGTLPFLMLLGEANTGLLKALDSYRDGASFGFGAWATWWAHRTIRSAIEENAKAVRLPLEKVELVNKLLRVRAELVRETVREPSAEQIAERMGATPDLVRDLLAIA